MHKQFLLPITLLYTANTD